MERGSCATISSKIFAIKKIMDEFSLLDLGNSSEILQAVEKKKQIEQLVIEIEGRFDAGGMFINHLEKEEVWSAFEGALQRNVAEETEVKDAYFSLPTNHTSDAMDVLWAAFEYVDLPLLFSDHQYAQFIRRLVDSKVIHQRIHESANDLFKKTKKETSVSFYYNLLNSAFLNKCLGQEKELNIDYPLPNEMKDFFGCFLENGTVNVAEVGEEAGYWLDGATLNIGKAGDELGRYMVSGHINAQSSGNKSGANAQGGFLHVDQSGDYFSYNAIGGTHSTWETGNHAGYFSNATLNVDKIPNENFHNFEEFYGTAVYGDSLEKVSDRCQDATILYNTPSFIKSNKYDHLIEYGEYSKAYSSKEEINVFDNDGYDRFMQLKNGIIVLDENFKLENSKPVTENMEAGIMVLRKSPENNIGIGMKGGILILEDKDLTVEEAKMRIYKDRLGGLILMRVPHKGLSGVTRLIDLEK